MISATQGAREHETTMHACWQLQHACAGHVHAGCMVIAAEYTPRHRLKHAHAAAAAAAAAALLERIMVNPSHDRGA